MFYTIEILEPIFDLADKMHGIKQLEDHHPEVDLFNHAVQVMNLAFRETDDTDLIIAAFIHDIGKIENRLGHDKIGARILNDIASAKTIWLVRNHMRFWNYIKGEMRRLSKVKEISGHPWLPELTQLARWDKAGRKPGHKVKFDRNDIIERLNKKVSEMFDMNLKR